MDIVSVRFGSQQIALVQRMADAEGVSASQYIRDASFARAVLDAARANATSVLMWEKLIAVVEEVGNDQLSAELRSLIGIAGELDDQPEPSNGNGNGH
jgi:hypothetical protein